MRILVTGGAGFIGSHFINHILARYPNYEVVNLDKLTYASAPENLTHIEKDPRYCFVHGDIGHPEQVKECVKGADTVVNFAAETHVDRSILNPMDFIQTDVVGAHVLLEAARDVKVKRFLQVSTDEVYGSRLHGSFKEGDPLSPSSPYSASKAAGDLLALSYHKTFGLPVIISRSSNNFGPYQFPEKLIPLFIIHAMEDRSLPLYGDGKNVRDWLFVADHCEALDLILHKGAPGEAYNIGGSNEKTNLEITDIILGRLRKTRALVKFVKDRAAHDRRYSVDCAKISGLGFTPRRTFIEAMHSTIDWYGNNRDWWEKRRSPEYWAIYRKIYKQ